MLKATSTMARRFCSTLSARHFQPMSDRVLVERVDPETKSAGGIMIPEQSQGKPLKGKVVSVGPGARADDGAVIPMLLKVGDTVMFKEYGGQKVKMDDKDYIIFREDEIIGKWKE